MLGDKKCSEKCRVRKYREEADRRVAHDDGAEIVPYLHEQASKSDHSSDCPNARENGLCREPVQVKGHAWDICHKPVVPGRTDAWGHKKCARCFDDFEERMHRLWGWPKTQKSS